MVPDGEVARGETLGFGVSFFCGPPSGAFGGPPMLILGVRLGRAGNPGAGSENDAPGGISASWGGINGPPAI